MAWIRTIDEQDAEGTLERLYRRIAGRTGRVAPGAVRESDVGSLREAGFGDRAILDICQVVSYFAFVNRMADGLGVTLEDD